MPSKWETSVLAAVAGLHVLVGCALYAYRPEPFVPAARSPQGAQSEQLIMLLEFPEPVRTARARSTPGRLRRLSAATSASVPGHGNLAEAISDSRDMTRHALDLHLPPPVETKFARPTLLENRPAISYQGTRYERAWISEGNLTHVVARRSRVAAVVLGLMGALVEECTEADRSHYKRGCVPDQYVHEAEELED